jgi:hypothetical protein
MTFEGLSTSELADIWYAVAGAEIRHPGCFTVVLEASDDELRRRLGDGLAPFLDHRFARLRPVDAVEDAEATRRAASDVSCEEAAPSGPASPKGGK